MHSYDVPSCSLREDDERNSEGNKPTSNNRSGWAVVATHRNLSHPDEQCICRLEYVWENHSETRTDQSSSQTGTLDCTTRCIRSHRESGAFRSGAKAIAEKW